jgi:hypothetical protein
MAAKKTASVALPSKEREHLEESTATIKAFVDVWTQLYWAFRHAFLGDPITVQAEAQFLQIKSEVARRHAFLFDQLGRLYIGGEHLTELLRKIVTLERVSKTQKDNYYKLEKHWHVIFINLNDSLMSIQFRLDQEDKQ